MNDFTNIVSKVMEVRPDEGDYTAEANREKRKKEAKGRLYPLPPFSAFTEGGVPPLQVICACPGKTAP